MRFVITQTCYGTTIVRKLKEDSFKGYFYLIVLFKGLDSCPQLEFFSICKYFGFYLKEVSNWSYSQESNCNSADCAHHICVISKQALLFPRVHLPFEYIIVSNMQHKIKCWTFLLRIVCFYFYKIGTLMLASKIKIIKDQMLHVDA